MLVIPRVYLLPPLVYVEKYLSSRVKRYFSLTFSLNFCGMTIDVVIVFPRNRRKKRALRTGIYEYLKPYVIDDFSGEV